MIIGKHQKLRGTRVFLEPGDVVFEVTPEDDDGWITVENIHGYQGEIPTSCINKGMNKHKHQPNLKKVENLFQSSDPYSP